MVQFRSDNINLIQIAYLGRMMDKKDASFSHGNSVNYNALTTLSLVGGKCA